jgi:diguanylate cyclase (GGDEF)-like protein
VQVAESIRGALAAPSKLKRPLTISVGISIISGTDIEAETILRQADSALYEAKGQGRDRICIFEDK